jgi:hypothetical protein
LKDKQDKIMKQAQVYIFIIAISILIGCKSPTTVTSSTQNTNFNDDVSNFRIKFNPDDVAVKNSTMQETSIKPPTSLQTPLGNMNVTLDTLMSEIAESNKSFTIKGYRIQIYSGLERKEAEKAIAELNNARLVFDERPELEYVQPNFKVKLGNYLDKPKAYETYYKIKGIFPSASIIYEKIKIPRYK